MIREYIWMDDKPVAMVDDTGTSPAIYYIHTDQVNRPQKLTDTSANLAWDGIFDPFGNLWSLPVNSVTMLLMFPGQYYDSETQLSQNWHRNYDPTIGRYIESDPIGLEGGINTYAYVESNPLRYIDPTGDAPRSPTFWCTWCGAPHGGCYGSYCPDCNDKSKDPNGDVPPNPDADEENNGEPNPAPQQNNYSAPPPWLPFALLPLMILALPAGM